MGVFVKAMMSFLPASILRGGWSGAKAGEQDRPPLLLISINCV